jgi:hypothetical protein
MVRVIEGVCFCENISDEKNDKLFIAMQKNIETGKQLSKPELINLKKSLLVP